MSNILWGVIWIKPPSRSSTISLQLHSWHQTLGDQACQGRKLELAKRGLPSTWISRGSPLKELHPLTLEEGIAEIDHYWYEIHGSHIPFKLPMGLSASPATYLEHCQRIWGPPAVREFRGAHLKIKITLLQWDKCMLLPEGGGTSMPIEGCLVGILIPATVKQSCINGFWDINC